jgi:hypothetical protein
MASGMKGDTGGPVGPGPEWLEPGHFLHERKWRGAARGRPRRERGQPPPPPRRPKRGNPTQKLRVPENVIASELLRRVRFPR